MYPVTSKRSAHQSGPGRASRCRSTAPSSPGSESNIPSNAGLSRQLIPAAHFRLLYEVHGYELFQLGLFNSDPHAGNVWTPAQTRRQAEADPTSYCRYLPNPDWKHFVRLEKQQFHLYRLLVWCPGVQTLSTLIEGRNARIRAKQFLHALHFIDRNERVFPEPHGADIIIDVGSLAVSWCFFAFRYCLKSCSLIY